MNGLSLGLFKESLALPDFPTRPDIKGIGLSDADLYSKRLQHKVSYTNTFLHSPPRLDITDIDAAEFGELDFLIASDVFEHVTPPVGRAFRNARRLLRQGGVFLLLQERFSSMKRS